MNLLRHLLAWFRRRRLDDELREELAQHVEWTAQRLADEGVPVAEARRRAAIETGNLSRLREDARRVWGFPSLDSLAQDVRYAVRQMRRAPMFAAVATISLAIGIGASAAVFTLADRMLLRKLAVPDPDSLVLLNWSAGLVMPFSSLNGNSRQDETGMGSTAFSLQALREMQAAARGAVDLFGFADLYDVNVSIDGRAEVLNAHAVSANYFDVLGMPASLGRPLGAADDRADSAPAAMISDAFWQRRFGRAPDAIGRTIAINGISFTIAGVAARGFGGTGQVLDAPELFVPLAWRGPLTRGGEKDDDPAYWWVLLMGRLRPGVTTAQLENTLDIVLQRTVAATKPQIAAKDLPKLHVLDGSRGQYEVRDRMRDSLKTMGLVVGIVLLVACANVANLLLARGQARVRELAVRTALGASRSRVVRQLFTEGALLAAGGALLGGAAARWITQGLRPALTGSANAPMPGIDWRLLAFVTALAGGCAVAFALVPALRSTRVTLTAGLQEAGRRGNSGPRRGWLAGGLVVAQIGLSMVLVVTASLLVRSLRNLDRAELGFDPANVLTFRIDPASNGYDAVRIRTVRDAVLTDLRAAPGVLDAAFTSHPLLSNASSIGVAARQEEPLPEPGSEAAPPFIRQHRAWRQTVSPGFFSTMKLPLVRGRAVDERDAAGSQRVAVVNQILARQLFGTDDVVGRRFRLGLARNAPLVEIVGVAANARYASVRDDMPATAYLPAAQQPPGAATFEVRTAASPDAFAATARAIVRRLDDQIPLVQLRSLSDQIARSLREERLFARLALLLGAVAVSLSAIGLYGLLAYGVAQRIPEIGIRMALGAGRRAVRWMVLRQSLLLAAAGLLLGGGGAYAATRTVESLLYGLPPRDPLTVAIAAIVMLATCLLAAYLPARRASRVDPLVALREN